jgi:predicted neutral ceramidase superfamily lipid hydrolase
MPFIPILSNAKAIIKVDWTRNIGLKFANNAKEIVKTATEHAPELGDNFKEVMAFARDMQRVGGEISDKKKNPVDKTQVTLALEVN